MNVRQPIGDIRVNLHRILKRPETLDQTTLRAVAGRNIIEN